MTQQSYELAQAYVTALTGDPETAMDWRALHDRDRGMPGQVQRGSLRQCWQWLCAWNDQQHGIFCTVAAMDGQGRKMENVSVLRASYADLDSADAQQQYERALSAYPQPSFAVQSSPGRFHVYWVTTPHADRQRFTMVQRRLVALFNGDHRVTDATRVMRVPGFLWHKAEPTLVTCWALPGFNTPTTIDTLDAATAHVVVQDVATGNRVPLGEGDQAPSLEWLQRALDLTDPNEMDRSAWVAFLYAFKQAGWTLTDEQTLQAMWLRFCERYEGNDVGDNIKQWKAVKDSEIGWKSLLHKVPSLRAMMSFDSAREQVIQPVADVPPMPTVGAPPPLDCSGEYLTHLEQQEWFRGCTFVVKLGSIMTPDGRFLNASQFNGKYGGKQFIITGEGKKTDEAWKAATRSTLWTVPKVDHIRFVPAEPHGAIIRDDLGREGVNTYKPAIVRRVEGDPSPFLRHLAMLLPDQNDQRILIEFMAHNIKFPGFKIPWAPVIQSTEGAGKGIFKRIMRHGLGGLYVHEPNAKELTSSGSQFNGWLRNKLFIIADEIKVDDKRDLIEVLKPLISEEWIEIQSKGIDQEVEDCFANWLFFSNYKDAIPINKNGRRYAVFYSALQTKDDKPAPAYYTELYNWIRGDGAAIVTDWLLRYPIERGAITMEAPDTSSTAEAVAIGRTPIERVIVDAVSDGLSGFRNGWISSLAVTKRCRDLGAVKGNIQPQTIAAIVEGMGYVEIGRADRPWFQEDKDQRAVLFARSSGADVRTYGMAQGYE